MAVISLYLEHMSDKVLSRTAETTSYDPDQIRTRLGMTQNQIEACKADGKESNELILALLFAWRESVEGVRHGVNQFNVMKKACGV